MAMDRRTILIGLGALGVVAFLAFRPTDTDAGAGDEGALDDDEGGGGGSGGGGGAWITPSSEVAFDTGVVDDAPDHSPDRKKKKQSRDLGGDGGGELMSFTWQADQKKSHGSYNYGGGGSGGASTKKKKKKSKGGGGGGAPRVQ